MDREAGARKDPIPPLTLRYEPTMGFVSTLSLALSLTTHGLSDAQQPLAALDAPVGHAVSEPRLQEAIQSARSSVGHLEVQGSHPGVIVRQESVFLIAPDLAVTSALALCNGNGVRIVMGEQSRSARVCALDWMHDIALLRLSSPFEEASGLPLRASDLVGHELAAAVGQTALGASVAQRSSLTGTIPIAPFRPIAQVQNLGQQGLAGTPLVDEQGRVIGMLSSRMLEESGTRFVVPSSAIAQMLCGEPLEFHQQAIPEIPENRDSEEYQAWQKNQLGVSLLLAGHSARALETLQSAQGMRGRVWLALAFLAEDRAVEAMQTLEQVLETHEATAEVRLVLGQAHAQLGEPRKASAQWQQARSLDRDSLATTLAVARGYTQIDREQDALGLLKGILTQSPEYVPALLLRGEIMNRRLRFQEARRYFEQVLGIDEQNPYAWVGMGQLQLNQKRHKRALQCFDRALAIRPGWLPAALGRCRVSVKSKKWEQALERVSPLRKVHPENVELLLIEARAHARLDAPETARDLFEEATFLDPQRIEAHQGLGLAYKDMDQYDRAVLAFDEVLRLDPNHSGALFSAGVCHLLKGDRGAARARHKALQRVDRAAADRLFKMIYNK